MIRKNNTYVYIMMVLMLYNCTKPIDFNQVNDLVLEPVVESSLIFYNAAAGDFFTGGTESSTAQDFVEIDFFSNDFIQNDLIKVEFVFNLENSINRAYRLQIRFLGSGGELLESFIINTDASENNQVIPSTHIEVFEGESLQRIKRSRIMEFTLEMLPGEAIDENTLGQISLQSKGVFYLRIER